MEGGRASRESFMSNCAATQVERQSPSSYLGLEEDSAVEMDISKLRPKLSAVYRRLIDQAAANKQKREDMESREEASKR
eukprot:4553953-Pyramimonas_sp.AAC.1